MKIIKSAPEKKNTPQRSPRTRIPLASVVSKSSTDDILVFRVRERY
jgi:hypothetical protein